MEESENVQNQQQNDAGKVEKQYNETIKKLIAVLGGGEPLKGNKKLPNDMLGTVVETLLKEERETLEKEVKEDLKKLLQGHTDLNKAVTTKEKELKDIKNQKQKEFTEAARKVFNKIENINLKEKEYYQSLQSAGEALGSSSDPQ